MRYPEGGGLSATGRARREKVRLQAAEWFAEGVAPPEVARRLRVSCNSAYVWRRRWRAGGKAALASGGPGGTVCRLSPAQLARLRPRWKQARRYGAGLRTSGGPWSG